MLRDNFKLNSILGFEFIFFDLTQKMKQFKNHPYQVPTTLNETNPCLTKFEKFLELNWFALIWSVAKLKQISVKEFLNCFSRERFKQTSLFSTIFINQSTQFRQPQPMNVDIQSVDWRYSLLFSCMVKAKGE